MGILHFRDTYRNNLSLLNLKAAITQTKHEYAQDNTVTTGLLWEMIKLKIREASIKYGKSKKENIKQNKDDIENQ